MKTLFTTSEIFRNVAALSGSAVVSFVLPALPSFGLVTAMIGTDFVSARRLARRIRRRLREAKPGDALPADAAERLKFSSMRLGHMLGRIGRCYGLLLLARGVDCVIVCSPEQYALRFVASLICFREFWSILENESSANNSSWASVARRVLVDKTSRHLGIDLQSYLDDAGITKKNDGK